MCQVMVEIELLHPNPGKHNDSRRPVFKGPHFLAGIEAVRRKPNPIE